MFGGPCGAYFGGGESTEGAVRSVGVVLDPPGFDNDLGFEERADLFDVQQFADAAVEAATSLCRRCASDDSKPPSGRSGLCTPRGDPAHDVVAPESEIRGMVREGHRSVGVATRAMVESTVA